MATDQPHPCDASVATTRDLWRVVSGFVPHLRIAHQIAGRVRLRLDACALDRKQLRDIGTERLREALGAIRGVRSIRLNVVALSAVVEYDSATIPDAAWADLLAGRETPDARVLIDLLQAGYEENLRGQL
jgi:hypothetical protein